MRISDWSSDVCSSDLVVAAGVCCQLRQGHRGAPLVVMPAVTAGDQGNAIPGPGLPARESGGKAGERPPRHGRGGPPRRSEEHTSELQSLMRISYAVFCLKKKKTTKQ